MAYDVGGDTETITELDKCFVKNNTEASICKTDLCNLDCAKRSSIPSSTKQPFSSSSHPSTSSEPLSPSTT
uniref:Uncharacterized protein n=1 Tax=Panagrolaimus sp. PS1159 TaxID=55785 RepID=A0AC35GQ41_9BILA